MMSAKFQTVLFLFIISLLSCSERNDYELQKSQLEKNKQLLGAVYRMFETGDVTGLENYVSKDFVDHTLDPMVLKTGIEGLKELIELNHTAFPDLKMKVYNLTAEGNMVYSHFNFSGINSGPIRDNPPTMKSIDLDGVDIIVIKDSKISEHWGYWDTLKFINRLGTSAKQQNAGSGID